MDVSYVNRMINVLSVSTINLLMQKSNLRKHKSTPKTRNYPVTKQLSAYRENTMRWLWREEKMINRLKKSEKKPIELKLR